MKKKLLSALSLLMLYFGSIAQTNIANYTFTSSVGSYVPLTGATTFTNSWDDVVSASIPLGGNFVFGGVTYTNCFISSNGFITFSVAPAGGNYTPMNTVAGTSGAIAGFACDANNSQAATAVPLISYMNVGSEFVVEYKDYATYGGRAAEKVNFQIRLNLTTNQIKIVYGACTIPNVVSTTYVPQVGLRGNTNTFASNVNNLLIGNVPNNNSCNWTNAVTGNVTGANMYYDANNLNVVPVNGLIYAWDPPAGALAPVRTHSAVAGISSNSAVIAWTAPANATQYNVQYRLQGSCGWTNFTGNPVIVPTASLTGLFQGSIYQVRVQSSNGTDNAIWSHIPNAAGSGNGYLAAGTFSTITSCTVPTAFNSTTVTTTSANYTWVPGSTETAWDVYYGTQPLAIPNQTTTPTTSTTSPSFSVTGLTPFTAYSIYVRANCGGPNGASNWTAVKNFTTIASCIVPSNLNPNSFSSTSANFTWTPGSSETNWDIYYGPQPLTVPTATTPPTTTTTSPTFSVTGLTAATAYAMYVRANCGGPNGVSIWTAVSNFTTNCNNSTLPFTEGFNAATIPSCWSQQYVTGTSNLQYVASSSNPNTTPFEGSNYVMWNGFSITNNNETRLVSPGITTTGTVSVDVNFRWVNENKTLYSTGQYLAEGVTVEYSLDGITWNTVQFFPRHDATLAAGTSQWNLKTITLPAGAGNQPTVYIGFKFHSGFGDNCSLDKVNVVASPPCVPPTALAVTSVSASSANFTWTAGGSETAWDIYYGVQPLTAPSGTTVPTATSAATNYSATGLTQSTPYSVYIRANCGGPSGVSAWTPVVVNFTTPAACPVISALNYNNLTSTSANYTWVPGGSEPSWDIYYGVQPLTVPTATTPPTTTSTSASYSVTGLTPGTGYDIYVRANCGGPGTSSWTAVSSFTTYCANSPLPISEGFNATTIPACWSQQYVVGNSNIQYVASATNPNTTPFEGTDYVKWNSYSISNNNESRLVSPPLTTTGTQSVDVNFRWYNENNTTYAAGQYTAEGVSVEYSLNGITWTTVQFFPRHDASFAAGTGAWNLKNITLPPGAGNQPTIFVGFRFHSGFGDNCSLDKVNILQTPTCTQTPVAGTITGPATATLYAAPGSYTLSPSVGTIQWYTAPSATSTVLAPISNATTTPFNYNASTTGTVFLTVIASNPGCVNDTANVALQVIVSPALGDMACNPYPLTVGPTTTYHKLTGFTVQSNEVAPPGTACQTNTTWCNATLNNTKWFSFIAPASGNVSVQSPGFDTQLAVWSATNCADLTTASSSATVIAANDDDGQYAAHGGAQFSSYTRATCLTPGATYYVQVDSYGNATVNDSTKVEIIDLGVNSFTALATSYCLPTSVTATLGANIPDGVFTIDANTTPVTAFDPTAAGVGTHTVSYNLFGCIANSVTTVGNSPTVSITGSNTICNGQSLVLTGNGANTYSWSTSATTSTISVTPVTTTNYTVTGTDANNCSNTATFALTVNSTPTVNATSSATLICNGSSAILTATGASTYSWNTTATTASISISPTVTTSYTVTGTTNGCSNTFVVSQAVSGCVGIDTKVASASGILVYPNPNTGEFTIELNNGSVKNIDVMDLTGRVVISNTSSNDKVDFNINTLANGIYYVRIQSNNTVEVIKIVKQ